MNQPDTFRIVQPDSGRLMTPLPIFTADIVLGLAGSLANHSGNPMQIDYTRDGLTYTPQVIVEPGDFEDVLKGD